MRRAYGALPRPALALLRKGLAPAAAHFPTPLGFVRALVACTLACTTVGLFCVYVELVKWRVVPGSCEHPQRVNTTSLLFDLQRADCQLLCAATRESKAA